MPGQNAPNKDHDIEDKNLKPKELADKIFSVDRRIRYIGIVGPAPKYELLESHMREDVTSLTPEKTDSEFVDIVPQVILGASEKLEKDLGAIEYSLTRYKNVTLVFFKTPEYTVTLSLEPGVVVKPLYERIMRSISSQGLLGEGAQRGKVTRK
jgi:hypothetical protein